MENNYKKAAFRKCFGILSTKEEQSCLENPRTGDKKLKTGNKYRYAFQGK